jgi:predicted transcriptional regulator
MPDFGFSTKVSIVFFMVVFFLATACTTTQQKEPFDPATCMETVPKEIKGLKILDGPRTKASIIRDMVPVVCNAQVLFQKMKKNGEDINAGKVIFLVTVEYTGEVYKADIEETTIQSDKFLREVSDFIMDTDFVGWARNDIDTVFEYPVIIVE